LEHKLNKISLDELKELDSIPDEMIDSEDEEEVKIQS